MLKRVLLALAAGASILSAQAGAATPPPKLEAFLAYPFLNGLAAPQSGDRIAWIETRKGARNIWLAEAPDFKPRRLTDATADDGQELAGLTFSPDGRTLAWSRGGGEHNPWANGLAPPNPASAVEQPKTEIWVSIAGAAPVKVAEDGEEPALSADGRLAYLKDGQVWTVDTAGKTKPARLFYDRGKVGDLAWSPDGSKLAFVSRRGDHSFIGVYGGPDKPLTWLAPATAFDGNPAWSPDGRRIAFSRQAGVADILDSPLVEKPNPFSIWVASVADGEGAPVWKSPVTLNGSFPQVPDGLFLMWGAGDRLTFRAELDGWAHLYSLPAAGGEPVLLTPGEFIVEHVAMTPDRKALLYSANTGGADGDIDRRHVFRVAVDKAGPTALTPGTGLEWTPVPVAGGKVAYIGSTATTAMRIAVAGKPLETPGSDYAANGLVVPRPVTFKAADGLTIHGQLFTPPNAKAKAPALIFVHGGPPRQMLLGWSYMDYYTHAYAMNQYLASRGFVVLSVNYRLGIGYGRAFQHPAKGGVAGNSEYQDVVAGAKFLQALPGVDPTRIGIWGGSYGGLLTAHALARNSDIFKVGVDFHGVHDWSLYPGKVGRPQRYEQGDYDAVLKSAFDSSPEAAMSGWTSPVLLIHGDDDRNVRFDQTVDLARRLAAQGAPFEELILPNEIHGFLRYDSWLRADTASVKFLEDRLKP
jgi:dipeptidyl aminopeptidase/acylaminoacyl peptidase